MCVASRVARADKHVPRQISWTPAVRPVVRNGRWTSDGSRMLLERRRYKYRPEGSAARRGRVVGRGHVPGEEGGALWGTDGRSQARNAEIDNRERTRARIEGSPRKFSNLKQLVCSTALDGMHPDNRIWVSVQSGMARSGGGGADEAASFPSVCTCVGSTPSAALVCPTLRIKPRGTIRQAAALESRRYLSAVIDRSIASHRSTTTAIDRFTAMHPQSWVASLPGVGGRASERASSAAVIEL